MSRSDNVCAHVVEVAVLWHDDILSVTHVRAEERVAFAGAGFALGVLPVASIRAPATLGETTEVREGSLVLRATRMLGERPTPRQRIDGRAVLAVLAAMVVHALAFAAFAKRAHDEGRDASALDVDELRSYLARSDGASTVTADVLTTDADDASHARSERRERAPIEKGIERTRTNAPNERAIAHEEEAFDDGRTFGMIRLLAQHEVTETFGASALWATPGSHDESTALWGNIATDSFGASGLDLSGVGRGGGGPGAGVDRGAIHTSGVEEGVGHGRGIGALRGHTASAICHLGFAEPLVVGKLPPEVIQRVVRQNAGRFRACYAEGVARSPSLSGHVATRFLIARDGSVSAVADAGSDLADARVVACVHHAFTDLAFPEPASTSVSVEYPLVFSPE